MIPRVLEPEVMDSAEEAEDYDAMGHGEVNRQFVDDFLAAWGADDASAVGGPRTVLDVGTGTAQIPIELVQRDRGAWAVTAIDLAEEMLRLAARNVKKAGHSASIHLECVDAKTLPFPDRCFEAVMSNSIIHHIPEPVTTLREMARVCQPGGLIFVRDLFRPASEAEIERLVETYAGDESPRQQQLFRQSLWAALTVEEVATLLEEVGLPDESVTATSDRHWTIALRT